MPTQQQRLSNYRLTGIWNMDMDQEDLLKQIWGKKKEADCMMRRI